MVWAVRLVDVTGSTNADLVQAARAGERGPRVLAARAQTAGRGRLGRAWQSAPGTSVSMSVLWAPAVPQPVWTWLPVVVGLGVLDAVEALGGTVGTGAGDVALKWPNDVVVTDPGAGSPAGQDGGEYGGEYGDEGGGEGGARAGLAKLAGILCEVATGPGGAVVVLGAGLNLGDPSLPADGATDRPRVSSLARVLGRAVGVEEALDVLAGTVQARLEGWEVAGGDPVRSRVAADYRPVCTTLGRRVVARTPGGRVAGTAVDLDADGSLVLQGEDGRVRVSAGDVEHLR